MANEKRDNTDGNNSGRRWVLPVVAAAAVLACAAVAMFVNRKPAERQSAESSVETVAAAVERQSAEPSVEPVTEAAEQQTAKLQDDTPVVIAEGESLVIPVSEITGEVSFYPFSVDGEDMEVLAVRASDGTIRTAFNTCQSCYTSGAGFYRFEDGELVCNNCGFRFSPDQVEVSSGGCNPWPIFEENKVVTKDSISIPYDFLSESKEIFANWKTKVS